MDYNILIADFAGKNRICMTDTLYQYDYGQKLKIESIPALPQTFEAHFSNVQHGGVSITVTGMDGIVDIPNSLLMTGKRIYCWIYVTEPGSGETEYQVLIPVQARPMPEYYDVTDVGVFDSVVQQVGDYAATATAGATNATASATAAATSASEAAASVSAAETAKNAAETAQGNAEDAQTAAETAAQTATEKAQQTAQDAAQAAQSKADAESAAGRAEAAQTGAESAKTDAETAAQGAAASASAASASASSAGQAATSAAQSATAAAGSATTAQGAAQTATTKAGEASASADAAAASETAAQTAQTAAEAAKDTAAVNATTATTKAAEAAQSASNAAQSKTDAEAAATRAETAAATLTVDDALSDTSTNPVENRVVTGAIRALQIEDTASGAIASFPDGSANPIQSLSVSLSPIQEGSGDPSPDNVRPITGRDSVTVTRTGKNLLKPSQYGIDDATPVRTTRCTLIVDGNEYIFTPTGTNEDAYLGVLTFIAVMDDEAFNQCILVEVKEPGNYTFSISNAIFNENYVQYLDKDRRVIRNPSSNTKISSNVGTVAVPDGTKWVNFRIGTLTGTAGTAYRFKVQFERGSTASSYEPYDGQSVTIQLGQTVYGGTVDVVSGTLTVDRAIADMGDLNWDKYQNNGLFYSTTLNRVIKKGSLAGGYDNAISSAYAPANIASISSLPDMSLSVDTGGNIQIRDSRHAASTSAEFKAALSGIQLAYELATPLEITLDPVTLSTLKGQNNVWSDADSVSVEYVADPKLYIARLTEPDADMIADANIVNGQYFMVNNTLYLATANIASGAAITPGVNCTRTNLAAALNAINA